MSVSVANNIPLTPISFLKFASRAHPRSIAWVYEDRRVTYADFNERCRRLANAIRSLQVEKGDIVSVLAPNVPAMLELHFAVPMLGAILNTINPRQDDSHFDYILAQAKPKVLFADVEYLARARSAIERSGSSCLLIQICDPLAGYKSDDDVAEYEELIRGYEPIYDLKTELSENDPIVLNYTSGTSGRPKGVVHSHRAAYLNTLGIVLLWNLPIFPVYLWVVPLFHCNGWCMSWAVTARAGTHVLMRKVVSEDIFAAIDHHRVTHFSCAPTVLDMLLATECLPDIGNGRIIRIGTGGSPPNSARIRRMRELGFETTHLYGLTETLSCSVYCAPQPDWENMDPSAYAVETRRQGVAQPIVEDVGIFDTETGDRLPHDGQSLGEIRIRSNTVMTSYFGDCEATDEAVHEGWFRTGDLGVCDSDGYIELKDRVKDIIISGGENVSTTEIEEVLAGHELVDEVAVVSMPDERWGEVPCAFVRRRISNEAINEEDLIEWCRKRLSGFKRPKRVVFVEELPYSATGKIQKNVLRAGFLSQA